jgi:hypothetical protein
MEEAIIFGHVILLDLVKNEILKGQKEKEKKDELTMWVERFGNDLILSRKNPEIMDMYLKVLDYIQNCDLYKSSALTEWSKKDVADGWLIAAACVGEYTITTFEERNNGLNPQYPSPEAKIPNICEHFSVECVDLFAMMRRLHFRL